MVMAAVCGSTDAQSKLIASHGSLLMGLYLMVSFSIISAATVHVATRHILKL